MGATVITANTINKMFYELLDQAQNWPKELRREGKMTVDSPGPVALNLTDPTKRILTIPQRLNSLPATAAETLWVLAGRDDMDFLSFYLKRAKDFSDDGKTWRAAYGPRLRGALCDTSVHWIDQLAHVVNELREHPNTRRAVITLLWPASDFENFTAKDFPCTQSIHFLPRDNRLDLVVFIRSNDILWGLSGVNIFEFTVLHEVVADMVRMPLGSYYHIADSLHYYTEFETRIQKIITADRFDIYDHVTPPNKPHLSMVGEPTLTAMDEHLKNFMGIEEYMRNDQGTFYYNMTNALREIIYLPLPLPDLCRCVLLYLVSKYPDKSVVKRSTIKSLLIQIRDQATVVAMVEWLLRTKSVEASWAHEILEAVPQYLRAKIGNFIKEVT